MVVVAAAAAVAVAGTAAQIFRRGHAAKLDGFADVFLDKVLEFMHFLLRVEKSAGDGIFQQCVAFFFKRGDFRRFQGLTAMLFFLEHLAFAHQAFILAARGGVGEEGVNALLDAAGLDVIDDGFAKFARFGFNFDGHNNFCAAQ